ncbi:MAG TPA: MFS transporter [Candidatus Limnocylindrales bacterium]|nr:MFS transporter [Candidatus Limnocylindrales bacterium]
MTARLAPYVALLRRNRSFRRLYAAQLVSFAGDWFATVALLGLALETTGSAAAASLVLVLQTGGFALASPIAGVLADRVDRRKLLIVADFARVPVALSFLLARDPSTFWIALLGVFLLSVGAAFFEPTSSAALPNLVEEDELGEANVLIGSAWGVMLAVGAAIGGLIAATFGRDIAFVVNASTFAISGLLIVGIHANFQQVRSPDGEQVPDGGGGFFGSLRVVLDFARHSRLVSSFLLSKTMFGVGTGVVLMLAVFAHDVFRAGDVGIGLLFAARGLGALIGPFLARALVGTTNRGLLLGIAGSVATIAIAYALFPLAPSIWIAALLVFAAHLGGGAQWMLSTLGLQRATPDHIRGRVFSFDYGLVTLTIALSVLLAGALSEALAPQAAVWTMVGLVAISGTAWIWFSAPARKAAAYTEPQT